MRPWSPDDLYDQAAAAAGSGDFAPLAATAPSSPDFIEDHPSGGLKSFLYRLDPDERAQLYMLVADEVRTAVQADFQTVHERERQERDVLLQQSTAQIRSEIKSELDDLARNTVDLAIAMAEQILRRALDLDRAALLRAVETIIYRAERGTRFTLVAHPDDASILEEHAAALADLNIVAIERDRRLERGGCVVNADGQEWDYTVSGRLESLAAVVRESLLGDQAVDEPGAPA